MDYTENANNALKHTNKQRFKKTLIFSGVLAIVLFTVCFSYFMLDLSDSYKEMRAKNPSSINWFPSLETQDIDENGSIVFEKPMSLRQYFAKDKKIKAKDIADYLGVDLDQELPQDYSFTMPTLNDIKVQKKVKKIIAGIKTGKILKCSYEITSNWGSRLHPTKHRWKHHSGIDLGVRYANFYAPMDGVVIEKKYSLWGYGKYILVDHGNGIKTRYAHLSKVSVEKGEKIVRGQYLGVTGNTGTSTGPHLHFEVIVNGKDVNPRKYSQFF